MKVTIIFFSPSGSTKKVANLISDEFKKYNWDVQLLNMTKDKVLFTDNSISGFINKIEPHDLLLIGGPIYIDHLHYNVLDVIKALPQADGEMYSKDAAVFTTFGKITPGVGSTEATLALKETGRRTLAALEIDSEHCITRNMSSLIGKNLPGDEIKPLVSELIKFLIDVVKGDKTIVNDVLEKLIDRYDDFPHLTDEREVTRLSFPNIEFDYSICKQCMLCVKKCPVNYLIIKDGYPATYPVDSCVHCTNCVYYCPTGAVIMDLSDKEGFYRKQLADQDLLPDGPSISKLILAD